VIFRPRHSIIRLQKSMATGLSVSIGRRDCHGGRWRRYLRRRLRPGIGVAGYTTASALIARTMTVAINNSVQHFVISS
jgi:hypothetical protein